MWLYLDLFTNVRGKSFGGNPEQSGAKGKKSVSSGSPRKSPGKPTRRSLSPAGSRRSSLSPPGSRRSTLKKSKIGKQGVSSAPHASANEANALYQYALREWLVGCTQALQKSVQNSIKDFVPPLGKVPEFISTSRLRNSAISLIKSKIVRSLFWPILYNWQSAELFWIKIIWSMVTLIRTRIGLNQK